MENQEFTAGDKIVLKNNKDIIYIFLFKVGDTYSHCLTPDNKEIDIYTIALEKYVEPKLFFGSL